MDQEFILYAVLALGIGYVLKDFINKNKTDDDGRLLDTAVTFDNVYEFLEGFKPVMSPKLKYGYTEKSVQKQLKEYLMSHYHTVIEEYGIGGLNATRIDLVVGYGDSAVGIEIKLARQLKKTTNLDRLYGQIHTYEKEFSSDLIVFIVGEKSELKDNALKNHIVNKLENSEATVMFCKIKALS